MNSNLLQQLSMNKLDENEYRKVLQKDVLQQEETQFEKKESLIENQEFGLCLMDNYDQEAYKIQKNGSEQIDRLRSVIQQIIEKKKKPSNYKILNKNSIQDENNQLQKISQVCRGCKLITTEELINLSCLHFYHIHCLQQKIDEQLNNANLFRLECECRNSILQKIVRVVYKNNLENLFQRQIQQIYSKYSHQLLKSKSCYFLCIKKSMNILLFCPNCSES